jgi:hypothetical protein
MNKMSEYKIERIGYGSQFNDLFIINNIIIKKSKSEYGNFKLDKEKRFYQYLINTRIDFPVPEIYEFGINYYKMNYLSNYFPLYTQFTNFSNNKKMVILNKIMSELNKLHSNTSKLITQNEFRELLIDETNTKIKKRYTEIIDIIDNYKFIEKVNNIKILSFDKIVEKIQDKIYNYINTLDTYKLTVIHGDCQFNNILYNPDTDEIKFIDPRGYFGDSDLYGIPEYDIAKVKFALSGYDIFDNMEINSLDINDNNLTIPNIYIINDDNLFVKDDIISILTISIWLGNAHCFKNNIPKAIFSFYYALYLGTLYL